MLIKAYFSTNVSKKACSAWDEKVSDMLINMSERDEIKTSLENSDALVILELMINNYQPKDASCLFSLIAIAHRSKRLKQASVRFKRMVYQALKLG